MSSMLTLLCWLLHGQYHPLCCSTAQFIHECAITCSFYLYSFHSSVLLSIDCCVNMLQSNQNMLLISSVYWEQSSLNYVNHILLKLYWLTPTAELLNCGLCASHKAQRAVSFIFLNEGWQHYSPNEPSGLGVLVSCAYSSAPASSLAN